MCVYVLFSAGSLSGLNDLTTNCSVFVEADLLSDKHISDEDEIGYFGLDMFLCM